MLGDTKRNGMSEFMWAMVALATGAAPSAIAAVLSSYVRRGGQPLDLLGLANIILLAAGLIAAGVSATVVFSKAKRAKTLISEIRGQQ